VWSCCRRCCCCCCGPATSLPPKRDELSGRGHQRKGAKRKKQAEMATLRTQFSQGAHAKKADGAVGVVVEDAPTIGRYANTVLLRLVADGSHTDRLSLDALIALTEAECQAALEGEWLAKRFKPTKEKAKKAKTKKRKAAEMSMSPTEVAAAAARHSALVASVETRLGPALGSRRTKAGQQREKRKIDLKEALGTTTQALNSWLASRLLPDKEGQLDTQVAAWLGDF
jgi:hypothetical protein